ncbi:MAG: hypothetical protein KA818_06390, partial [Methanoculleus sp.]|nr:hypothetical protein [Methanoculleus sp.]
TMPTKTAYNIVKTIPIWLRISLFGSIVMDADHGDDERSGREQGWGHDEDVIPGRRNPDDKDSCLCDTIGDAAYHCQDS